MRTLADKLGDIFNSCSLDMTKTCQRLIVEHRTIQQNITRFCVKWLETLATDPCVGVDARNEASVKVAKMLHEKCPEAFEEPIPFI